MLGAAPPLPEAVAGMTESIPPQDDPATADELLRAEVHRLATTVIRHAGSCPPVGSARWWHAGDAERIASLLVLAEAWLVVDPERVAAERVKQMAVDVSQELHRQRALIRARQQEIRRALQRGDAGRAVDLTAHHAGWQWDEEAV